MEYRFYLYHQDIGKWTRVTDPLGWDALEKNASRFGEDGSPAGPWHGIIFSYTTKLRFVKDGKNFVQAFYEQYGIEQNILLRIERRNLLNRKFEVFYEGRLNLHVYKVTTIYVECNVEQTGFVQKLKNGSEIKQEVAHTHIVELHSKALRKQVVKQFPTNPSFEYSTWFGDGTAYILPVMENVIEEMEPSPIYPANVENGIQVNPTKPDDDLKYQLKIVGFGGTLSLKTLCRIEIRAVDSDYGFGEFFNTILNTEIIIAHRNDSAVTYTTIPVFSKNDGVATEFGEVNSGFIDINNTTNLTVEDGDEIYWYFKSVSNVDVNRIAWDGVQSITFTVDTVTDASECKVAMVHEAFESVVQSITGKAQPFYSEHFGRTDIGYAADGAGALRGITNINQIRGIDKPIRCTFKDLVQTAWSLDAVGIGIERVDGVERVRVEPLTFWYQAKRMMRLNFVLDIDKSVYGQLYFNQIDGGTDKWANEKVTNLDEVNASREWTLPITQVKSKLDIKCPYITSSFSIEYARRESNQPSKDTKFDDENVIIRLRRDGENFVPEKDEDFDTITGVIAPETSYNLADSPARCLRRHGRVLRSFLEKQKDDYIRFSAGAANTQMVSQLTGEAAAVDEDGEILISSLDSPLYLAEVYEVRANLTTEQLAALNETDPDTDANVWGFVEFSYTDRDWKRGYLLSARQAPDSKEVKLQLLKANI